MGFVLLSRRGEGREEQGEQTEEVLRQGDAGLIAP